MKGVPMMVTMPPGETPSGLLVDARGRPLSAAARAVACPHCGRGPDKRQATSGFGPMRSSICECGHEFPAERV